MKIDINVNCALEYILIVTLQLHILNVFVKYFFINPLNTSSEALHKIYYHVAQRVLLTFQDKSYS